MTRTQQDETNGLSRGTLDAVLASMTDACVLFDSEGRVANYNDASVVFYRLQSPEAWPRSMAELASILDVRTLGGEPITTDSCAVCRTLRGEVVPSVEYRLMRKDTGERWVGRYTCTPVRDAENRVVGALVIARDITQEKRMYERLVDSENRYRSLVETTSDWVWEIDANGNYRYASPKVTELLGFLPEEVVGRSPFEFMAPKEAERVQSLCSPLMRNHKPIRGVENVNIRKDGRTVVLETNATPIFAGDGTFEGYRGMDRDITIRKRALEQVVHSRDLMRYVLEHMHSAVAIHDRDLNYLYVSEQYLRDYGIKEKDVIGKHHYEVFPDLPEKFRDAHQRALKGEVLSSDEDTYFRADGSLDWTRWQCRPWYEASGEVGGIIVYTEVITKRKLAENALRESERRHRDIVQTAMDGFWRVDLSGRLLEVNAAYCRMTGYTEQELTRMRIADLEYMESPHEVMERTRHIIENGEARFESWHRRKDGSAFPVEVGVQYKAEDSGHLVVFIRDLTLYRQAQDALQVSEERWKYALEGSGDGVWDWNAQTDEVQYTEQWKKILGYSGAEIGNTLAEWDSRIHPDDRAGVYVALDAHVRGETPSYASEHRLQGKDGIYKWILDRGKVLTRTADGKPLRVIGTHCDISARKRAEEESDALKGQLVQAQKMESIGRLAGGVAHDFNNLLTVINGYSQMALGKMRASDPLWPSITEINKAGQRAAELTRQLLAFSRKQVLQPQLFDLNEVVSGMESMLQRLVGDDVTLHIMLDSQPVRVYADPHQLEQVVMNLVVNARDAMPSGGDVVIETSTGNEMGGNAVKTGGTPGQRWAVLTVSDNGTGMDEQTMHHIFEPFFTTKTESQGTGLGLSMAQGIVVQSGGQIEVSSELGVGSSFTIFLPATEGTVEPQPEAHPRATTLGGSETILLVEDQAEVRAYVAAVLQALGYQVLQAADGVEALKIAGRQGSAIDLVLTDLMMPGIGGQELADDLRKLDSAIKVLIMSGYARDWEETRKDGTGEATAFITKPFTPDALAGKLREVLGGRRPARAKVLIADDEAGVRSFARTVLEQAGYDIVEAADGKEALREFAKQRVDLLITDIVMPEKEGLETIQSIRRGYPATPILAISGAFGGQFLLAAQMLGARAVLSKPIAAEALVAKVAELLQRA